MIYRKIKKLFRKLFVKIVVLFGFLLVIGNLIRLFYPFFGYIGFQLHSIRNYNNIAYANIEGIIGNNFKKPHNPKAFYINCNIGEDGGYGRFYMTTNKMCIKGNIEPSNVNHEYVHYSLWNLSIQDKLEMRNYIKHLRNLIIIDFENIDIKELRGDDIMFYHIIKNEIKKYSNSPSYIFYDRLEKFIISYWGNEEYVTYAIGTIIYLEDNGKLEFTDYDLNNSVLFNIYEIYKKIYSKMLIID